jgi:RNA polymerase sigma-70 factor (ECF subfamily)
LEPTIETSEERQLIQSAQDGDRQAFCRLFQLYRRPVFRSLLPLVGNREDAMDITQDAFVRAHRAIRRFDTERPFFPWIYRIARNLGITLLKKRQASENSIRLDDHEPGESPFEIADEGADPRRESSDRQLEQLLLETLNTLNAQDREILVLRDLEERSYREIAEALDIPQGTVMSRLYYARERLRKKMEAYL